MKLVFNGNAGYTMREPVIKNISIEITSGHLYCILGPNGCGKTTLLLTLSGALNPLKGKIERVNYNKSIYISPDPPYLPSLRIGDVILSVSNTDGKLILYKNQDKETIREAIKTYTLLGLDKQMNDYYEKLSSGEKMKIMLSAALVIKDKALFLDEPNNHLDIKSRIILYKLLREKSREKIIVISLHDINEASLHCEKIIIIYRNGEAIGPGEPIETLKKENLEKAYQINLKEIKYEGHLLFLPLLTT